MRIFRLLQVNKGKQKLLLDLLNIFGLGMGIAVFMFILQYARYEWSYDKFHEDADRIYRVTYIREQPGKEPYVSAASFPALGPAVAREFEEVEAACRVVPVWGLKGLIVWEERSVESEFINYADENVFEFFSFRLLQGNPANALKDQHTAVLSQSKAAALFGDENALGQRIEMQTRDGRYFFEVTGVFDDAVATHMTTDIFLSWKSLYAIPNVDRETIEQNWRWSQYPAYIKLIDQATPEQLIAKFPGLVQKYIPERPDKAWISFGLQPLTSIHLNSHLYREIDQNGDAQVVNTLVIVGFLVLVIAWINYVNLYTARVSDHFKAVGIRKALGASRVGLFIRYLKESMVFGMMAIVMALGLLYALQPWVAQQVGPDFPSQSLLSLDYLPLLLVLWITTALVCGIYPALVISGITPLKALANDQRSSSGRLRKVLVVFQFMASALLVGGTLIIQQQLSYMAGLHTKVNKENVLAIDTYLYDLGGREHQRKLRLFKNILSGQPGVQGVAYASEVVGQGTAYSTNSTVMGGISGEEGARIVDMEIVGPDYLQLIEADLLAGRYFEYELDSQNLIINQAAMKLYGFQNPEQALSQSIVFPGTGDTLQVVGVVEDYLQQSAREGIRPMVFRNNHWELSKVAVRIDAERLVGFLDFAREEHRRLFPKSPFNYGMIDEIVAENNSGEQNFARLFNLFGFLTIFIALLGILALSYFVAEKRKREICVRKVLGSTNQSVISLVFKDFAKLVLTGNLLAVPLIYFAAEQWLNQFAYRISFDWTIPFIAALLSLLLAFAFSYLNLIQLAKSNPAQVLRSE